MWHLGPAWDDEDRLARAWHTATPFAHLVCDDFLPEATLSALLAILEEEPVERYEGDIFVFDASASEPTTPGLKALRDSFTSVLGPALSRITGKRVRRADMRAYAYRVGHYLLPHSDHQQDLGRAIAYAYYLPSPDPPAGGELEMFSCRSEGGELVSIETARTIEPRPNRLVVFEVSECSLHQVREVLSGLRISLAGWFYP